jgi:hypothetical protein
MNTFIDITTSILPDNRNKYPCREPGRSHVATSPLDVLMKHVCSDQDPGGLWRARARSTL